MSALVLLSAASCKSKEKSANGDSSTTSSKMNSTDKKYRLVVSFNSIGTGINGDAYNKMEAFAKNHAKKPKYETYSWGREGETDVAFNLKEMNDKDQVKFIEELKAAIGDTDRVTYKENEAPTGKLRKNL